LLGLPLLFRSFRRGLRFSRASRRSIRKWASEWPEAAPAKIASRLNSCATSLKRSDSRQRCLARRISRCRNSQHQAREVNGEPDRLRLSWAHLVKMSYLACVGIYWILSCSLSYFLENDPQKGDNKIQQGQLVRRTGCLVRFRQ
jgi:hypothetical protein